jgi:anti-anti-sigma factor
MSDADSSGGAIDVSSRDGFAVEVERPAPGVILVRVKGALDLWTSLPLLDAILAAFSDHPRLIAVDMSDATAMDATGLRTLVEGSGHIEEGGVRFAIVCAAGSVVAGLLEQAGPSRTLNVYESADDALGLDGAGELPAGV